MTPNPVQRAVDLARAAYTAAILAGHHEWTGDTAARVYVCLRDEATAAVEAAALGLVYEAYTAPDHAAHVRSLTGAPDRSIQGICLRTPS